MKAIITGISGQDGAYLASLLIEQQYQVLGLVRSMSQSDLSNLSYLNIQDQVFIRQCDLLDLSQLVKILSEFKPTVVFNLAAQSSVSESFNQPIGTITFNTTSVLNWLEAIKLIDPKIKFYQASSSEMFGKIKNLPINEETEFHPTSPYAISKAAAHWACVNYKESYGMHICCGILFNHESYLRKPNFFVKKVIAQSLEISRGTRDSLIVGNIDVARDFGYAPDYVHAMYLMMQQEEPVNCLICSGTPTYLRHIVEYVFQRLDIPMNRLVISKELYRPADIDVIYGNPEKAAEALNWRYSMSIEQMIDKLIEEESRPKGRLHQD